MRVTLDTNQFLRSLMRPPELATFIMAWQARRFTVVCSTQLLEEYETTLTYPKIARLIFPELRRMFLTQLVHEMELVALPQIDAICRDPDDDKVIATAVMAVLIILPQRMRIYAWNRCAAYCGHKEFVSQPLMRS